MLRLVRRHGDRVGIGDSPLSLPRGWKNPRQFGGGLRTGVWAVRATAQTPRAFDYVVMAKKGDIVIKEKYVFSKGQFWADAKDTQPVECAFAKSDLPEDWRTSVKFYAAPRDSFGNRGRACST